MGRIAAVLALILQAGPAEGQKQPVPPAEDQAKAKKLIHTLFEPDYARRSSEGRRELARKLLSHAPKTADDPPAHYVILSEASTLAAKAGDPKTALAAIAALEAAFEVDAVTLRTEALDAARTSTRTADGARVVAEGYLDLVDAALAADNYDAAAAAASKGAAAARKARDSALVAEFRDRSKEIGSLRRVFNRIKKDVAKLKTDPDDPAGNLALGEFLCLLRGEWARGLAHLARGSDASLKKLAEQDLAAPTDASLQVAVGDGWWARAEKERDATRKANLAGRAHHWYSRAMPNLRSIARIKLELRLAEAAKLSAGASSRRRAPVDLIPWIDVRLDAVADGGRWSWRGKTLISDTAGGIRYAKIRIPCQPPDEYDLKLVVKRTEAEEAGFYIGLLTRERRFTAMLDYTDDATTSSVGRFEGESGEDLADLHRGEKVIHRDRTLLPPGKPTAVLVSVRRNRLTVKVEGATIIDWKNPTYATAEVSSRLEVPDKRCLFLAARDRTIFEISEIKLTPISGTPRRLRGR